MKAMRRAACLGLAGLCTALPATWPQPAAAVEGVAPPAIYPPDTWTGRGVAVVRVLDRLDSHVELLTIPAGETGHYKSLSITARNCLQNAPGLPPDEAAVLDIRDAHAGTPDFSGWMFEAEPFLGVFQSPIFGISLASCSGPDVAPAAPPLPQPPVPQLSDAQGAPNGAPGPADASPGAPPPPPDGGPTPVFPSGVPEPPPPQDEAPPPGN